MKIKLVAAGVIAVGDYQAGEVYDVEDDEAKRLIEVKGFVLADEEMIQEDEDQKKRVAELTSFTVNAPAFVSEPVATKAAKKTELATIAVAETTTNKGES